MNTNKEIPPAVKQSMVEPSPLTPVEVSGFSIELVDSTSFRTFFAMFFDETHATVLRKEWRFHRTKNGVERYALWDGAVSVPVKYANAKLQEFVVLNSNTPPNWRPVEGIMDGCYYVVKVKTTGAMEVNYINTPECSNEKSVRLLYKKMEYWLNRPKKYFEKLR